MHSFPSMPIAPASKFRKLSLFAIAFAHLLLAYALQHGTSTQQPRPQELIVTLIAPAFVAPHIIKTVPLSVTPPKLSPTAISLPAVDTVLAITQIANDTPQIQASQLPNKSTPVDNTIATAAPQVVKIKQVSAVEYLRLPQPDYPALAKRMGEQGKVVMQVQVNEQGKAEKVDIQQSSGFNRLDEAARLAVMRAVFKPYIEDGKPLMIVTTATVSFSLSG